MTASTKTASQRGRASRNKGAIWERDVTTAIRPWFPEVRRSRDNGSSTTSDTGDLVDTSPGIFWSLKDDKAGDMGKPSVLTAWQNEALLKADGRIPLIVQKRRGHADPLTAWCWMPLADLVDLACKSYQGGIHHPGTWVRLEFLDALNLLAAAGYARTPAVAA